MPDLLGCCTCVMIVHPASVISLKPLVSNFGICCIPYWGLPVAKSSSQSFGVAQSSIIQGKAGRAQISTNDNFRCSPVQMTYTGFICLLDLSAVCMKAKNIIFCHYFVPSHMPPIIAMAQHVHQPYVCVISWASGSCNLTGAASYMEHDKEQKASLEWLVGHILC